MKFGNRYTMDQKKADKILEVILSIFCIFLSVFLTIRSVVHSQHDELMPFS